MIIVANTTFSFSFFTARDIGTSTLPWKRRALGLRAKTTAFTQVSSLKQRLMSLQLKVKTLTDTKDEAKKQADELIATCDQLHTQINTANTKLINQRTTIQVGHLITS